jgi:hypothetical protein
MSFEAAWTQAAPLLDRALAHAGRTHRLADVRAVIETGQAQLWSCAGAAMVTLIEDDPCDRRLLIWLAGGDLQALLTQFRLPMERWAKAQGCRRVLLIGRPGWERTLRIFGYAPTARILAKEL